MRQEVKKENGNYRVIDSMQASKNMIVRREVKLNSKHTTQSCKIECFSYGDIIARLTINYNSNEQELELLMPEQELTRASRNHLTEFKRMFALQEIPVVTL